MAAAAAAAASGHGVAAMSHQSYPTYHPHNPYYHPDLAYFGGQHHQYNMANSAAMFRSDAYDAYHQAAASSESRYQLL